MFYNQPLAIRFGTEFLRHVDHSKRIEPYWDTLDIAVAWVRASGIAYLSDHLRNFLLHGGQLSITVGIDLQNTTREGLQALLDLEQFGRCKTFVYHNEAGSVFHPKLYLFRNDEEARLIVGSNNLTESGLYVNVEAGLQVDADVDSPLVGQALDALSSWRDTTSNLSVRLDQDFLEQLSRYGYVPNEAAARARMRRERMRSSRQDAAPLFAARRFVPPPSGAEPAAPSNPGSRGTKKQASTAAADGTVLLMRLRKASATGRPTQTQIPFRVKDAFFVGATHVLSVHSYEQHGIHPASARGGRNTIKLEIPEMRDYAQPVARFEKTPDGIVYETYDAESVQGKQIMASLEEGRVDNSTQLSVSDAERATWWRFI